MKTIIFMILLTASINGGEIDEDTTCPLLKYPPVYEKQENEIIEIWCVDEEDPKLFHIFDEKGNHIYDLKIDKKED